MKYKKFEELPVWQESRKLVNSAYAIIRSNKKLSSDFSLCDQFKRASYSIMLNIAEGFERGSSKDFAHFIDFAKGSSCETRAILYIMIDNKYIDAAQFEESYKQTENISAQLSNLKKYLIGNEFKKNF